MTISINKCVYRGTIDTPKTQSGTRNLKLLPIALYALRQLLENRNRADNFVFHTEQGKPMLSVTNLSRKFKKLLKSIGLPEATPHTARHFFTSLMINQKEEQLTTSKYLGHIDTTMVAKVYLHMFKQEANEPIRLSTNLTSIGDIIAV